MRMWMCDPKILCNHHLLGEHFELHKHRHMFIKGQSILKRISLNQIEPKSMQLRHDIIISEMRLRGMNHKSPYIQPGLELYSDDIKGYEIDKVKALQDLIDRCPECKERNETK